MKNRVSVIGLGNALLQDDSVGLHVVETLKKEYRFEPQIDLIDGGTAGLDLLPVLEDYGKVLFVDAVDAGESSGTTVIVKGDAIPSFLVAQVSVHHIGLSDLLFAARMTDSLPVEICLVGVQPKTVDIGLEMTDTLKESLGPILATVLKQLQEWGVEPVRLQQTAVPSE